MDLLPKFFSPDCPSLKICGVTSAHDAEQLVVAKVPALGVNFWPQSKRYCSPEQARHFLPALNERIVRVGVFVNNAREVAPALLDAGLIDVVQLHGDEGEDELRFFLDQGHPVVRSLTLPNKASVLQTIAHYQSLATATSGTLALLLDAHAPGVYGGTGQTIDWAAAGEFIRQCHPLPVLLAGGIQPNNAKEAIQQTNPAGLDVASGAESSPGRKDFQKVSALLAATQSVEAP